MSVIEGIFTAQETKAIADIVANDSLPRVGYDWRFVNFVGDIQYVEARKARKWLRAIEFVSGQPYASADDMRVKARASGVLQISTDFNHDVILPDKANLRFRAAHDLHHIREDGCNFVLDGEICAYSKFVAYDVRGEFHSILFQEIVAQTCYLRHFGDFPVGNIYDTNAFAPFIAKVNHAYKVG